MSIKPSQITEVLDLAKKIVDKGGKFNPCFSGDAGLGKSEICQQWAKSQGKDFGLIDLRLAYMERPDVLGMPSMVTLNGVEMTIHALPEFLPREGQGLLLLEEPNRADESVTNGLMQLLTDRKIHKYSLPQGWLIAACINEGVNYSVNTMDFALRNRFEMFEVKYNQKDFVSYMREVGYDSKIVAFVESGIWVYKAVDEIGDDGHYISPRSFYKLNKAEIEGEVSQTSIYHEAICAVLGQAVGNDYYKFINEVKPVLFKDIVKDKKGALKKLKEYADSKDYKADLVSVTVDSVLGAFKKKECSPDLLSDIVSIIDPDQAVNLIMNAFDEEEDPENLEKFMKKNESLRASLKKRISKGLKDAE